MEQLVSGRASGPAARLLDGYLGYRSAGVAPAEYPGLPSPWLTIVLALDEPLRVAAHPDPREPGGDFEALIGGLHTTPARIAHEGSQSGVQLALSPLAVPALIGVPAGELAGLDLHAQDVLGPKVRHLRERLVATQTWAGRFALLDRVLAEWVRETGGPAPEVVRAWRLLMARGGLVRVEELASEVGWSARHLGVRFRRDIGLSPKQAARVIRFDRTRRALRAAPGARLTDVAASYGYYDQAHMSREFRGLAGLAPSQWLAQEKIGFVQDASGSRLASSRV